MIGATVNTMLGTRLEAEFRSRPARTRSYWQLESDGQAGASDEAAVLVAMATEQVLSISTVRRITFVGGIIAR